VSCYPSMLQLVYASGARNHVLLHRWSHVVSVIHAKILGRCTAADLQGENARARASNNSRPGGGGGGGELLQVVEVRAGLCFEWSIFVLF
jgi:hypothetical protein